MSIINVHQDLALANAELARRRAEVERLTRDRDLAERKAAVCREDAEINARRAESAEAEVERLIESHGHLTARFAELEAALRPFADACRPGGFGNAVSMHHWQRARALLSPQPAPLPDLTFDADDPLPDMTPAPCATCGDPAHAAADALAMDYKCPDCRGGRTK